MADFTGRHAAPMSGAPAAAADIDAGLRGYMLGIYNLMALGLGVTGLVALGVAASPELMGAIFGTPLRWVVMLAPLGIVLMVSFRFQTMRTGTLHTLYWVFTVLMGVSMAALLWRYDPMSVARAFFITAAAFAGLSLYGYTTKRSLSGMGSFLIMGLIGLLLASVINIFVASTMMQFIISVGGVLIFAGLTAYDTQNLKNAYFEVAGSEHERRTSIMGAWSLYLDFLNMFQFILALTGITSSDD